MNQNAEQLARDAIDRQLAQSGWIVQSRKERNLTGGTEVAIREYPTDVGPADYVLFVDQKPVGLIKAKREEEGYRLSVHEDQAAAYATSKLKRLDNQPLRFVYESTGAITHFTDYHDPNPPRTGGLWLSPARNLPAVVRGSKKFSGKDARYTLTSC